MNEIAVAGAALARTVVDAVRSVVPAARGTAALHEPEFKGNEWKYVKDCLDSGWVSSVGSYVDRFERMIAELTGAACAVATANGTAALHICLLLAGVGRGDEVLIPALTFIATANAVSYAGAIPHLADVSTSSLGLDPGKLDDYLREIAEVREGKCVNRRTSAVIRAVMPMHTFGFPADLDSLQEVCDRWCLVMVEDAAESLGSLYKGRHTGTVGKLGGLSFNGNKIVTTGGGGAIITNDQRLGSLAKHLTTTARVPHRWSFVHDSVGYNYRLPNLNAALGCAQLEELPGFVDRKRRLAERYFQAFASVEGVSLFREPPGTRSNYWLNTLVTRDRDVGLRDRILEALNASGLQARPAWTLMHRLPMYSRCPRMDLSVAEAMEDRIVNLPSSAILAD